MTKAYRPKTHVNNWFEEFCLEKEKVDTFQVKRIENRLLIEKTRRIFDNFYKNVELEAPKDQIRIGGIVQLMPTHMNISEEDNIDFRPVLSVNVSGSAARYSEHVDELCELSIASSLRSFVRNSFRITNFDMKNHTNEFLKYGQKFRLTCVDNDKNPLLLYASPKSMNLNTSFYTANVSYKRGEINLPLGLVRQSNCGFGKRIPTGHTTWCCQSIKPRERFDTEGTLVPSNKPIVITHVATNKNLAVENITMETLFGPEYLVSVQDYKDIFKRNMKQNFWMISNGSQ